MRLGSFYHSRSNNCGLNPESWSCPDLLAPFSWSRGIRSHHQPPTQLAKQKSREHYKGLQSMCPSSAMGKLVSAAEA